MENITNKPPKYLTDIISSQEMFAAIEKIQNTLNLHIDQSGELYVIVCDIIMGKSKSSDFIKNVIEKLSVDQDFAQKIAVQTNNEIFDVVKNKLQSQTLVQTENVPPSTNTTLERVGNFSIEPTIGEGSDGSTGPGTHWKEVTAADRNKILAGVEDPERLGGTSSSSRSEENHAEPIVDYLLQNSVGQRERTDVVSHTHASAAPPTNLPVVEGTMQTSPAKTPVTAHSTPPTSTPVPPRSGPDPYHEPVA